MSYQYAYLIGDILLLGVWIALYIARKDLHHQQLVVSLCSAPLAPISQILWFSKDYWRPEYAIAFKVLGVSLGFEEILFSFCIGGISSVLYETIFHKIFRAGHKRIVTTLGVLSVFFIVLLVAKYYGLNTVWASSLAFISASVVMLWIDRDLRTDWIMSSVLMFVLISTLYLTWLYLYPHLTERFWISSSFSGVEFLGIPIEELVWFVSWAMFSGIIYEFWLNAGPYRSLKK